MPSRLRFSFAWGALCLLLTYSSASAQTASLVKDINTVPYAPYDSEPAGYTEFNGAVYFSASSTPGEFGLWKTDGTSAGTQLVKGGLSCEQFLVSGGVLYFIANDGAHGDELWKSDGTTAGTVIVKDMNPGIGDGLRFGPVEFAGALYFAATGSIANFELWRSDGTAQGTVLVKDIHPSQSSLPFSLTVVDDTLFFAARDESSGHELWRSDGTSQGTVLVKDINPGPTSSNPLLMVNAGGMLLFRASDGVNGDELWKSDGTPGGTVMVRDINPGLGSSSDGVFESRLFEFKGVAFFGSNSGDSIGLWKSDGTLQGTQLVKDDLIPAAFQPAETALYFLEQSEELPVFGSRLWKTDGTTPGTQLLESFEEGQIEQSLAAVGDTLFFAAGPSVFEHGLWKSDGTAEGAVALKDIGRGTDYHFAAIGDTLFLSVYSDETGEEPWTSDGTVDGTGLLKNIGNSPSNGAGPYILSANSSDGSGGLYFIGNDGTHGVEWWKSDGTAEGTLLVKDINPTDGSAIYTSGELLSVGDTVFFAGDDGANGFELWKTDGTPDGTVMLKDINPQPGESSLPGLFTELNGVVIFTADDHSRGIELWRTDGTAEGTVLLKDILPGTLGSLPSPLIRSANRVFFTAYGGVSGRAIWTTDGTPAGTVLVRDIYPAEEGPYDDLVGSGGLLYFRADSVGPSGATRLWRSDGTPGGTFPIHTFTPTSALSFEPWMTDVGGTLFFIQGDGLWKTNGTAQSTAQVKPLDNALRTSSTFGSASRVLYFAVEGTDRDELWRSDGTGAGTVVVKQFPRPASSFNQPLLRLIGEEAGALFLSAETSAGYQLWRSHGTAESTTAVPNSFLNHLGPVVSFGPNVYFAAEEKDTGRELWSAPLLPAISSGGIVDAAGFRPTLARGSLASIFGVELSTATAAAQSLPLPTSLAGAGVQVNGVDAPLLFVSPRQINFEVPAETALGNASIVTVLGEHQSPAEPALLTEYAPGLFVNPATGEPIIQRHPDGALITAQNPAKPGDILILYITGIGGLNNHPANGAAASDSPLSTSLVLPTVTIDGQSAIVSFAGLAPGFVGLGQINIEVPAGIPQGSSLPLVVRFGESASQTLQLPF